MTALREAPEQVAGPDLLVEAEARFPFVARPLRPISGMATVIGLVLLSVSGVGAGLLFGLGGSFLSPDSTMIFAGSIGAVLAVAAASRFWPELIVKFSARA